MKLKRKTAKYFYMKIIVTIGTGNSGCSAMHDFIMKKYCYYKVNVDKKYKSLC